MTDAPIAWTVAYVLEATGARLVSGEETGRFHAVSTDSRTIERGALFVAIKGEKHDGHGFVKNAFEKGAAGVLVNDDYLAGRSDISFGGQSWIAVPDTIRALGDLAAFARRRSNVSVVGITGTNGKTTTKEMTAAVLGEGFEVLKTPGNFNNLIGLPLTLFSLRDSHEWAVLELAMNRPGEIHRLSEIAGPDIGVITNVEAGHLAGVKDLDGVMEAKGELLEVLGHDGTAVLNGDDQRICRLAERFGGRVVTFGIESSAEVSGTVISQKRSGSSFELNWYDGSIIVALNIPGKGAIYNALAAAAVGYRAGLSIEQVKRGLESVVASAGRMEVSRIGAVNLVDDTYNANPGSVERAIETLGALKGSGRGIFVFGDMLELGEYSKIAHKRIGTLAARAGLARLYATGEFANTVAEGALAAGMDGTRIFTGDKDEIVNALMKDLCPGDWVMVKGSRRMAMDEVVDRLRMEIAKRLKSPRPFRADRGGPG